MQRGVVTRRRAAPARRRRHLRRDRSTRWPASRNVGLLRVRGRTGRRVAGLRRSTRATTAELAVVGVAAQRDPLAREARHQACAAGRLSGAALSSTFSGRQPVHVHDRRPARRRAGRRRSAYGSTDVVARHQALSRHRRGRTRTPRRGRSPAPLPGSRRGWPSGVQRRSRTCRRPHTASSLTSRPVDPAVAVVELAGVVGGQARARSAPRPDASVVKLALLAPARARPRERAPV